MKKIIPLSLVAVLSLSATEIELAPIGVESTVITEVAQNAQISADLAEALNNNIPSIDMSRRSGIANDVFIRGQKRDNISVEVDGTKVCGACPNRMDPPTSHILANQVEDVEVIEGPYDVTTFGTMSGGLKVTTKKPTKELSGEVTAGVGSWGYRKLGATVSGGNDTIRVLVTGSTETSGQYEDGDGNTLSQQTKNKATMAGNTYQTQYENLDAYEKKSVMAKVFVNVTDDQELRLSYTGNRSENILYPSTPMDAAYDDSNIYSIEYNIANLSDTAKNINLQYYYSDVDHPMDTKYRNARTVIGTNSFYMTNQLQTSMKGLKLKTDFDIDNTKILFGLDGNSRMWQGEKFMTNDISGIRMPSTVSLTHTETDNAAIFAKVEKSFGAIDIQAGARYDSTDITPDDITKNKRSFNALNAHLITTYNLNSASKVFLGFGKASRVPDARELYLVGMNPSSNNNLDQTTNKEIDLGYELQNDSMKFKVKTFYSDLDNYIYLHKTSATTSTFENIDAKVYGAEISSEYFLTDTITLDASASYKRGKKDNALSATNTDTDLADIAPLRGTIGATYEYANNSTFSAEIVASDRWDTIDSDNGEQELAGWSIVNLKAKHAFGKNLDLTVGANNIFDVTFAQSNTYADLVLSATTGSEKILMNEPGRYLYTNLTYKF